MKHPLEPYAQLYDAVSARLGPQRSPLLIGIDGANGSGKSSTASWLAWQFGMPVIHLDFYIDKGTAALTRSAAEVARLIDRRIDQGKPIIVEGILLLEALATVGRKPDVLIFVEGEPIGSVLVDRILGYWSQYRPREKADFVVSGHNAALT
jgi:uridine kinase